MKRLLVWYWNWHIRGEKHFDGYLKPPYNQSSPPKIGHVKTLKEQLKDLWDPERTYAPPYFQDYRVGMPPNDRLDWERYYEASGRYFRDSQLEDVCALLTVVLVLFTATALFLTLLY